MIRTVVIDDEQKSVLMLINFLQAYCPQVVIVGSANDAQTGRELIEQVNPQLVFLDIEMPVGSGFDLLRSLKNISFEVIFVTAYDQYALNAFRYSALDYLLKPVRIVQLKEAVTKAELRLAERRTTHDYELLMRNMGEQQAGKQKIAFTDKGEQYFVQLEDIMYCIASASYTHVHTMKKTFISARHLKEFEDMLPNDMFCRIHHGHLINLSYIAKLQKGRGGAVIMQDGRQLEIAVRRKTELLGRFGK